MRTQLPEELERALQGVGSQFFSSFPSYDFQQNTQWKYLVDAGLGATASNAATGQKNAMQILMKLKTQFAGDLRSDWLPQVVDIPVLLPDGGMDIVGGLFDQLTSFPSQADAKGIETAAINTGLAIAQNFLSAVPVYGQMASAVIGFAKMFISLFTQKEEVIIRRAPWEQYSRDTDTDVVNQVLKGVFEGFDWTPCFSPPTSSSAGWKFEKAKENYQRVWAPLLPEGKDRWKVDWTQGVGFLPGTQRMVRTSQGILLLDKNNQGEPKGIDAWSTTETGDFYPATSQFLTSAWQMVMRGGNPDMYKVQAAALHDTWADHFGSMWDDWKDTYQRLQDGGTKKWYEALLLGRMMGTYIVSRRYDHEAWAPADAYYQADNEAFFHPRIEDIGPYDTEHYAINCQEGSDCAYARNRQYRYIWPAIVRPALSRLRNRQWWYLSRSLVCAYVRPIDVAGKPAYSAFQDPTPAGGGESWGQKLTRRCLEMRQVLLSHPERFKVRLADVDYIDPQFAQQLRQSGVKEDSWRYTGPHTQLAQGSIASTGLGNDNEPPPDPEPGAEGGFPGAKFIIGKLDAPPWAGGIHESVLQRRAGGLTPSEVMTGVLKGTLMITVIGGGIWVVNNALRGTLMSAGSRIRIR